jgi:hypothetical protein
MWAHRPARKETVREHGVDGGLIGSLISVHVRLGREWDTQSLLYPQFRGITLCITCDLSLKRHPESAA